MEEMRVKEWESKSLRVVVDDLKKGWFWYSPGIPMAWGRALEQVFGNMLDDIRVVEAVYRTWTTGYGPNFRYHYKLIIKVDRNVEELLKSREARVLTAGDVIFGGTSKDIWFDGDTITLSATY